MREKRWECPNIEDLHNKFEITQLLGKSSVFEKNKTSRIYLINSKLLNYYVNPRCLKNDWVNKRSVLLGWTIDFQAMLGECPQTHYAKTIFPINCRLNLQNPPWPELQEKWGWPEWWEKRWDGQNVFGGRMGLSSFLLPLLP